jgi:hypothetical protein
MHVILVKNYVFFWTKACKSSLVLAIVRPQHAIILQALQNNLYRNGIIVICDAFFCDNRGVLVRKCNVLKLQQCINLLLFYKIIFAIRFYRLVVHQSYGISSHQLEIVFRLNQQQEGNGPFKITSIPFLSRRIQGPLFVTCDFQILSRLNK